MDKGQEYETRLKKLFVGGLNRNTSDDTVKDYFAKYGELEDSVVIRDSTTKASRGFGYVTYSDHRCTFQVLAEKKEKGHNIDGKDVEVKRAIPRDDRNPTAHTKTKKIFIGGLKKDVEESDVKDEIAKVLEVSDSSIVKVDLIRDRETQEMRGFGFIEFEDEDTVDTLCCIKNLPIKGKMVEVKKAESRNKDGGGGGGSRGGGFGARGGGGSRGGGFGMGRGGGYTYSHGGGGGYDASAYGAGGMYGTAAGGMGYGAASYGGGYVGGFGGMGGMHGQAATNFGPQRAAYGGSMNGVGARNFGGGNRGAMGRFKPY